MPAMAPSKNKASTKKYVLCLKGWSHENIHGQKKISMDRYHFKETEPPDITNFIKDLYEKVLINPGNSPLLRHYCPYSGILFAKKK